jgi:hypothetical protein
VNTDELEFALAKAERRVLGIQAKLHQWASDDPHRRFDDCTTSSACATRRCLSVRGRETFSCVLS